MTVTVKYMYPIYAEVDLVEGAVVRVAVDDEASSQAVEVLATAAIYRHLGLDAPQAPQQNDLWRAQ